MSQFRPSSAAGYFYPGNKDKLNEQVESLFRTIDTEKTFNHISGLVAPHAGYIYSGKTAAHAYNTIKEKSYKNVIIISPSHREYFQGNSVYNGDGYITPLGIVDVNKELVQKLTDNSKNIFKGIQGHREEHGIEVHLPFLQFLLSDFKIVPVVMGDQSKIYIDELANKIAEILDDQTLIVASSDLSHFYPRYKANELDSVVEKRIGDYDYEGLYNDLEHKKCEACGGGPIVAMMKSLDIIKKNKSLVLHRSDSGETTGDIKEVVGYLSDAIYN
jgi:AmmeMemoRadiSam system protein B